MSVEASETLPDPVQKALECEMCTHARQHGWWGDSRNTHCFKCHRTWRRTNKQAHCTICHEHFSSVTTFDRHFVRGECADPSTITNKKGQRLLFADDRGIWHGPPRESA